MTTDYDKLLNIAVDLGCRLLRSGGEIYRVEESMGRLLSAYGVESPEVFTIPKCVIVSITAPDGHPITRMRRVGEHGTDLELLERCNELCRDLCAMTPPLDVAQERLDSLEERTHRYVHWQVLLGYGIAPAFFSPLFGGGVPDLLASALGGLAVGVCLLYMRRFISSNVFFRTAICSALASLVSLLLVELGLGSSVDTVTISVLMVLVPGVSLTNAMREIMAGDTISGLSRGADAILIASAIAIGSAAGLGLAHLL